MRFGPVAALIVLVAYFGIELYAMSRAREQTEADYIYGQLVGARSAAERCGDVSPAEFERYGAVVDRVRRRLERDLAEDEGLDATAVARRVSEVGDAAELGVVATIEAEGCGGPTIPRRLRQFRIYLRK